MAIGMVPATGGAGGGLDPATFPEPDSNAAAPEPCALLRDGGGGGGKLGDFDVRIMASGIEGRPAVGSGGAAADGLDGRDSPPGGAGIAEVRGFGSNSPKTSRSDPSVLFSIATPP